MGNSNDIGTHKPRVAFICVHNSCRSQIAEALGKHLASDVFESYSAGTETKNRINPDAVRIMKQLYGIDMEETQYPKLLEDIPLWILLLQWDAMSNVHICLACTERTGDWMIRQERMIVILLKLLRKLKLR